MTVALTHGHEKSFLSCSALPKDFLELALYNGRENTLKKKDNNDLWTSDCKVSWYLNVLFKDNYEVDGIGFSVAIPCVSTEVGAAAGSGIDAGGTAPVAPLSKGSDETGLASTSSLDAHK